MMTLIAAALAAAQPAAAPADQMGQMPMMHTGQSSDHKAMPCCKDCCKDMTGKDAEHKGHPAQ